MKKLLSIFAALLLVFGLAACGQTNNDGEDTEDMSNYSYTTVDINPSVEFIVDEDNKVVSVYLANEDAEIVAAKLDLVGLDLAEALKLYVTSAIETGYIDVDSNENIVTITNQDEAEENAVKEDVEAVLANERVGAAIFGGEMNDEYVALAEQYAIGVGQARMISRAVELSDDLTFEAALELSHSEIMTILVDAHRAKMETFIAERKAAAQNTQNEMREDAEARVAVHREDVKNKLVDAPDYDAIRNNVEANIDEIRSNYENRMNQMRDRINNAVPDTTSYNYTSIDINPSIEFVVDEDGIVVSVYLANEDAEIVAADLVLVGLPIEEAIDLYIQAAIETGYLDVDSTENIVTVTTEDAVLEEEVKASVENALANRGVGAAIFGGEMSEEYVALAEQYGIGVGRARLISRAVALSDGLTFEQALELSHQEIMSMLVEEHQASMDEFVSERKAAALETKEQMRTQAMTRVAAHLENVEAGLVDTPNYEAIRDQVESNLDAVRNRIQNRIDQEKNEATDESTDETTDESTDETTEESTDETTNENDQTV